MSLGRNGGEAGWPRALNKYRLPIILDVVAAMEARPGGLAHGSTNQVCLSWWFVAPCER